MNFRIRNATLDDADIIADYNSRLAEETEGRPLQADTIGPGVRTILGDATKGRYWVADVAGRVVGQIMVTYEWSDWRNGTIWWIQSVYVHPDERRTGVFSALYRHVQRAARDDGAVGLRLYVEVENERAQKTYLSLGMVDPNYRVMEAVFGDAKC